MWESISTTSNFASGLSSGYDKKCPTKAVWRWKDVFGWRSEKVHICCARDGPGLRAGGSRSHALCSSGSRGKLVPVLSSLLLLFPLLFSLSSQSMGICCSGPEWMFTRLLPSVRPVWEMFQKHTQIVASSVSSAPVRWPRLYQDCTIIPRLPSVSAEPYFLSGWWGGQGLTTAGCWAAMVTKHV